MQITFGQLVKFIKVIEQPCLYPDKKRKSFFKRVFDNLKWYFDNGRINEDYNLYGLDLVGTNSDNYLTHKERFEDVIRFEHIYKFNSLLNNIEDKYLFYLFCKNNKLSHPRVMLSYNNGHISIIHDDIDKILQNNYIFAKQTIGYGGYEVRCIKNLKMFDAIKADWKDKTYIIQEGVKNHKNISRIYPNSLNTIRCVTVSDRKQIGFFSAVLRCGTSVSGSVDNVSSGGLVIGIDKHGKLMKYGHYDDFYKKKVIVHPDTGVRFEGIEVPFFNEVIKLAIRAHECIKEIPSIGWDIAVTESGVILIEGNYYWGLQIMQMCHGGLKNEWKNIYKE